MIGRFFKWITDKFFSKPQCPPYMFMGRRNCRLFYMRPVNEHADVICNQCWLRHYGVYKD